MALTFKNGKMYDGANPFTGTADGKTYKDGVEVPPMASWIITMLTQIPDLKALFDKVRNPDGSFKYDAATIAGMITDTDWYRTNGATVSQRLIDRYKGGENAYRDAVNAAKGTVSKIASDLGLNASDPGISQYLAALSENAYLHGWGSTQIESVITSNPEIVKHIKGGVYAAQAQDIADYGNIMGYVVTAGDRANYVQRLLGLTNQDGVRVRSSVDDIKAEIRRNTALRYGVFAEQINQGVSLWDLTSAYRQKAADLLEMDPDAIKWDDPLFRDGKIFQSVDPKTGQIVARPLWEADKMIKGDERWQYTKNAADTYDKMTFGILSKFGMVK